MKTFYSVEEIYEEIKQDIVDLKLYPGQVISENEMAQKFNVSRTVIRPAFIKLKTEKLIVVYPQRGTIISLIDMNYVSDLLYMRTAIEKQICVDATYELNPSICLKIERNLKQQEKFIGQEVYDANCRNLDDEFHRLLFALVGKETCWDMLIGNTVHFQRYRSLDINFAKRSKQLVEEHKLIYQCIREKNRSKLYEEVSNHLSYSFYHVMKDILKRYPEYFLR